MPLIFVYGTLKTGYGLNRFLVSAKAKLIEPNAVLDKQLCFVDGGITALVSPRRGDKTYKPVGEVWDVPAKHLPELDSIEGAYVRTKAVTMAGNAVEYYHGRKRSWWDNGARTGPYITVDEDAGTMVWDRPDRYKPDPVRAARYAKTQADDGDE